MSYTSVHSGIAPTRGREIKRQERGSKVMDSATTDIFHRLRSAQVRCRRKGRGFTSVKRI